VPRWPSVLDLAAGGFDRRARALGGADALQMHRRLQLARQHYLGAHREYRHDLRRLERREVNHPGRQLGQLVQTHFAALRLERGTEADLRHAPLQRHLAALEADLVIAALARPLSLDAPPASLALACRRTAPDAQPGTARTLDRLDGIQSHVTYAPPSTCGRPH